MQLSPDPESTLLEGLADGRDRVGPHPLDADLSIDALGVALGVEASELAVDATFRATVGRARSPCFPRAGDTVDPAATPFRLLAVGPIGHDQGAVALDHEIGRLESIRVVVAAGRELDLPDRREAAFRRAPPGTA